MARRGDTKSLLEKEVDDRRLMSAHVEYSIEPNVSAFQKTLGVVLVSLAIASICLSFIFIVRSVYEATHPKLDINLPDLPNFSVFYDNKGELVPTKQPPASKPGQIQNPMPSVAGVSQPEVINFLDQIAESQDPIASKMTKSELVSVGKTVCRSFHRQFLWVDHRSTRSEVLISLVAAMWKKYPNEPGIKSFSSTMVSASINHLCPQYK